MSMTVEQMIRVDAPAEAVFAKASDIEGSPAQQPKIKRIEMLTPGPVGIGTRWNETRAMGKKEATVTLEITEFDPPRSYTVECDSAGTHYTTTISAEPAGDSSTLRATVHAKPSGFFAGLLAKMVMGMMRKEIHEDLLCIKRAAESS